MNWNQTIKKFYQDAGTKFQIPKKGSEDYLKIRSIYDKAPKPEKKAPVPRVKKAAPADGKKTRRRAIKETTDIILPTLGLLQQVAPGTKIKAPKKSSSTYKKEGPSIQSIAENEVLEEKERRKKVEKAKKDILDTEEISEFKTERKQKKERAAAEEKERTEMIIEPPTEEEARAMKRRERLDKKKEKIEEKLEDIELDEEFKEKKSSILEKRKEAGLMVVDTPLTDLISVNIIDTPREIEAFESAANPTVPDVEMLDMTAFERRPAAKRRASIEDDVMLDRDAETIDTVGPTKKLKKKDGKAKVVIEGSGSFRPRRQFIKLP